MTQREEMKIRCQSRPWHDGIEILIKSGRSYVKKFAMVEVKPNEPMESCLSLSRDTAQLLMDDLWNCGIRPTEGTGSAGSLKATEKHLDDMRRIVFKDFDKMGVDKRQP